MSPRFKSIETKHMEERARFFEALKTLDRRAFLKVSAAAFGAAAASGLVTPHSFQPVKVFAQAAGGKQQPFTFAYISDSHLYKRTLNDRFVNALLRAVDDVSFASSISSRARVRSPLPRHSRAITTRQR